MNNALIENNTIIIDYGGPTRIINVRDLPEPLVRNNVMIGGVGEDYINGNNGRDILIGGSTDTEANEMALAAILTEWSATDAVPGSLGTVSDDSPDVDTMYGRSGADRFWANELEDLLPDFLDPPDTLTPTP